MGENTYGLNWSDERVAELMRLFNDGLNKPQIAAVMGTTRLAVRNKLRRLGLSRPDKISIWTDERIEELKRLFNEKLSATETAAKMGGGLTRLSIIGKWHRLGLKRGRKDTYRRPVGLQARKPTICSVSQWSAFSIESKPQKLPDEPVVDVTPFHISLDELSVKTCRWPYGKGPYTFCGCDVVSGPYCVAHASKAYEKRPAKKRRTTKVMERVAA
jgi:GcrA cell cycle regulator